MTSFDNGELPTNMMEATPQDVQGVLDAIDTLLIDSTNLNAGPSEEVELIGFPRVTNEQDVYYRIFQNLAREKGLTEHQLAEKLEDMRLYDLHPLEGMDSFQVRRFSEPDEGTVGMVIRRFSDGETKVAHIHETRRGLKIHFDYDLPGVPRASVADCSEMKIQLGSTFVLGQ